jgi:peptidoglycan/xylan/chitin deacetylase (PgdA/CDA1 family)
MSGVALTFDDGPDPRGTPAVLEALAAAGVRATFFVLGERAERAPELLATLGHLRLTRWRLPWGALAPYSQALAGEHGLRLVGWTADTHDWRGDAAELMLEALALEPGAIVLMHDGVGPGARRGDCAQTARLVGPLVRRIRARGLEPGEIPSDAPVGNPDFRVRATA